MFIRLEQVTKIFNRGEPSEVHALREVSLEVARGEMLCIQGPSGSGKTTLLSILGCLFVPTSGLATIDGRRISRLPDHFLTRYRRELIGFVFQQAHLLERMSALDNVCLPLVPLGVPPSERRRRGMQLLERLEVEHRAGFAAGRLSGGEAQRIALARALINDPPLIIADEPTAHLDSRSSTQIMDLLAGLKKDGRTLVISSHDPLVIGYPMVDRVVSVRDGRIGTGSG